MWNWKWLAFWRKRKNVYSITFKAVDNAVTASCCWPACQGEGDDEKMRVCGDFAGFVSMILNGSFLPSIQMGVAARGQATGDERMSRTILGLINKGAATSQPQEPSKDDEVYVSPGVVFDPRGFQDSKRLPEETEQEDD